MATTNDARPMFIAGEWRQGSDGGTTPTFNPATEEQIAEVAAGTAEDVDRAVEAAKQAAPEWGGRPWTERANILRQIAGRIRDDVDRVAIIDVDNAGLPITTARVDALRAADEIDYFAGIAGETKGDTLPSQSGVVSYSIREPYGVVGRIIPFNHPFNFSAAKIAAPLAAGNTVILKAPDQTPSLPSHLLNSLKTSSRPAFCLCSPATVPRSVVPSHPTPISPASHSSAASKQGVL